MIGREIRDIAYSMFRGRRGPYVGSDAERKKKKRIILDWAVHLEISVESAIIFHLSFFFNQSP